MFFLLYRHTHNSVFDDFPKILENLSEGHMNIAQHFLKIAEDFRGRPEDVLIMHQQIKDKLCSSEIIDILTSEDMENTPLESRM